VSQLETYLASEFVENKTDLIEIDKLLQSVSKTFVATFHDEFAWPYELKGPNLDRATKFSQSTTAMILLSLLGLLGASNSLVQTDEIEAPVFPGVEFTEADERLIKENIAKASKLLAAEVLKDKKFEARSGTFGTNDPLTISWLCALSQADWGRLGLNATDWKNIAEAIPYEQEQTTADYLKNPEKFVHIQKEHDAGVQSHSFWALKLLQKIAMRTKNKFPQADFLNYFEENLHEQLSFSSIPDSRFDPAELAFSLEGMILSQRNAVDRSVVSRVIEVLTSAQKQNAYWRPVKPILSTVQGMVLFPVSVEVANSLLRSISIVDGRRQHDTFGAIALPLFKRYLGWLRARSVTIRADETEITGWHSEHVNRRSIIHTWETSQVIEFLVSFRRLLKWQMANDLLVHSRFQVTPFKGANKEEARLLWDKTQKKFEPVTSMGEAAATYLQIGKSYIPEGGKHPHNYSFLLYGPPGTGKTTVAENLAAALGYQMITITVSDFLAGGAAQLEARAKTIFDVLKSQPGCVVLFDEIDHFLLDRDSGLYESQDSQFQFMTPGMLTKLNELRREGRIIFIIATNYEERIDAAIKRVGRIDNKYLLLPPDAKQRMSIMRKFFEDKKLSFESLSGTNQKKLEKASLFLGFNDLDATFRKLKDADPNSMAEKYEELLRSRARTISLEAYTSRFSKESGSYPFEEFFALLWLSIEVGDADEAPTKKIISTVTKRLMSNFGTTEKIGIEEFRRKFPNFSSEVAEKVYQRTEAYMN